LLRHAEYTRDRIAQLCRRIGEQIYTAHAPAAALSVAGPTERISHAEAQRLRGDAFRPASVGDRFGPDWATFWFRAEFDVPRDWAGSRVDLIWDSESEATLWVNGQSVQGLNTKHGDRPDAVLVERAVGGERLSIQVEMACNNKFGVSRPDGVSMPVDGGGQPFTLRRCGIARFNPDAWALHFDAITLHDLYQELTRDGDVSERSWAGLLLAELNRFCNAIDVDDATTWPAAREILRGLYEHRNASRQFELSAIGHAHIDTAWLWPLAETDRKCERSFATATTYMRDYPEYRFSCSQAYQYDVIKKRNPKLYERIRAAVKAGQWVVVGGTWIEPDCNIPSGESLCRQFLVGQRFFEREFGRRCREFWNPDVFGYNGQLPQIMRLCGCTRFLTQKLSWNRFNKPQHHTFTWQGMDGSEVLAHFPPADSYNAMTDHPGWTHVTWLRSNAKRFKDHDRSHHGMMLYGFGDGGGGPTKPMLETIRRCADLQGVPRTRQRTSDEFFELLEADVIDRPLQIGELYFEYHRGTYTSQAQVKRDNRRAEHLLHDLEFLATASGKPYPRDAIDRLWKVLLLNQFHDILPGSSIKQVYEDSARQFRELFAEGERLIDDVAGHGQALVNTTGFARHDVVESSGGAMSFVEARPFAAARPATPRSAVQVVEQGGTFELSNGELAAKFDRGGALVSLIHRGRGRQALAGSGNVFETYDDRPVVHDAWDVDPFHLETRRPAAPARAARVMRSDPLRCELAFEYRIGRSSTMTQVVRLDADSRRLEFHCHVDWHEAQTFLKVAFPINARAMNATYEMQFGHVERPTHFNTSFDVAKYEVPLHRWFDLAEHGFGCAVLNDSKYGGSTFGNTMRLSLLRAPGSPDPTCDRGRHRFAFALLPHAGDWRDANVVAEACTFNAPLRAVGAAAAPAKSFVTCDDANLAIDTIKRAEDDDEATIVRLYECHGARGTATLTFAAPFARAVFCNVLEDELGPATTHGGQVHVQYAPHQIITLKLS
jgi:alpha-mannosidase